MTYISLVPPRETYRRLTHEYITYSCNTLCISVSPQERLRISGTVLYTVDGTVDR